MELALHAGAARPVSRAALWTGRVLGGIAVLFLLFSATVKLLRAPQALESFEQLGYPPSVALGIGLVELACTLLYLWPRTSFAGAVLLTGYLGGAVATHLRIGDPARAMIPLMCGVLAWGGLYLRNEKLRALIRA